MAAHRKAAHLKSTQRTRDPLLLGIDAGTSRVRALVFTPRGVVLSEGSRTAPTHRPRTGWAEQDPEGIWNACCAAIRTALRPIDHPEDIRGLAIGSVGEACVPLDAAGEPTYPAIAWYDERPISELGPLFHRISQDQLFEITGLSADPTFTLMKLLWLRTHAPDALARTSRILNLTHYLAWRLTGVPGSDYTQASRSLALDLHRKQWASDLIREAGIDPSLFQQLRPLGAKLGTVAPDVASMLGLPRDCAVGVGGHDHLVGALAADALRPGTMLNSLGTAEAVTMALEYSSNDLELGRRGFNQGVVLVDDRTIPYVFGGFQTSGASIEWFRGLFGQSIDHDDLIRSAEAIGPGADGVTFVPDLRGKLLPVPDPFARGAWFGLNADCDRATLYRAILEGLAFEARQSIDALSDIEGIPKVATIRAIGGNTQNPLLMRIKASVYHQAITSAEMPEGTALGAALLGGLAAGLWPDLRSAVDGLTVSYHRTDPVDDWVDCYAQKYREVFRPAYAALRPLHHALHNLVV
ncbi:MAG: FGGY-family carbohydrate kinase [Geminicoccaceae bacterium]